MKTLEEVKEIMGTDKVFETATSFGVNVFGKYQPNITFIIPKEFKINPLNYRKDVPTKSMISNMNIDFDGSAEVLFGDFWRSKKGGACFRPKPVKSAQHVLVRVNWGGAFCSTRGSCSSGIGETYFRQAASNGRGTGYDYWVFPVGFKRLIYNEEIDGDSSSIELSLTEQAKLVRDQIIKYDREQAEKAEAEAKAKAKAEVASQAAKPELTPRLEVLDNRLMAIGQKADIKFEDASFKYRWNSFLYSKENVDKVEQQIIRLETQFAEKECKRLIREEFELKFQKFESRIIDLGFEISFHEDRVYFKKDGFDFNYGHPYSHEGLLSFTEELSGLEKQAVEEKAKAEIEARYNELRQQGKEAGFPRDVRIWHRRGGRTNAGDGWVIGSDGQGREPTGMYNENPRRLSRYGEGEMIWEQILPGEVVLKWSKSCSATSHEFEVVHLPEEGLTEEQLERISEIEAEIEREWENACGLASGKPSSPVGEGWGLILKKFQEAKKDEQLLEKEPSKPHSLADLCKKYNKKREVNK